MTVHEGVYEWDLYKKRKKTDTRSECSIWRLIPMPDGECLMYANGCKYGVKNKEVQKETNENSKFRTFTLIINFRTLICINSNIIHKGKDIRSL